jgi:hypothetical protein
MAICSLDLRSHASPPGSATAIFENINEDFPGKQRFESPSRSAAISTGCTGRRCRTRPPRAAVAKGQMTEMVACALRDQRNQGIFD